MSIQPIIESLDSLVNVHRDLIRVSKEKTEVLKEGSAEDLQKVLIHEQKYIHKLEQAENERENVVKAWFTEYQLTDENQTITRMLNLLTCDEEKKQLEDAAVALTQAITQLKQHEQLNKSLIQQSMQFIQMSLSMLQPSMRKMNYDRPHQTRQTHVRGQSVFDSKA